MQLQIFSLGPTVFVYDFGVRLLNLLKTSGF